MRENNQLGGVSIRRKEVTSWDVLLQKWRFPRGRVKFHVGASSMILLLVSISSLAALEISFH
jgi:hypothetical protein